MKPAWVIALISAVITAPLQAKVLTINDAILLTLRHNPNIQNAYLQRVVDKFNLRASEHAFEPLFQFSADGSLARDRTFVSANNATHTSTHSYSASPSMTYLSPIGTSTTVSMSNAFGNQSYLPGLSVAITQPLMKGFGSRIAEAPLRAAYDSEYLNRLRLRETIISSIDATIATYYTVVTDLNNLQTAIDAAKSAKKTVWQNQQRIKAGEMAPNDNIQAESQLAEYQFNVTDAQNTLYNDRLRLLQAIGMLNSEIQLDVPTAIAMPNDRVLSSEKSYEIALQNNIEYQNTVIAVRVAARNLMLSQDNARWGLNLTANYGLTSTHKGFTGLFERDVNHESSVDLKLTIPLEDLQNHIAILQTKLALREALVALEQKKRDLKLDVKNKLFALKNRRLQIKQALLHVKLAQKSLMLEKKKLQFGLSTMVNVTNLQDTVIRAENSVTSAKVGYITALNSYYDTLGTTVERWHITIHY